MKNCFAFILCLFLSLALLGKDTTSIKKETFLYAVKDKDSLFLDKYTPIKGKGETLYLAKNKPSKNGRASCRERVYDLVCVSVVAV